MKLASKQIEDLSRGEPVRLSLPEIGDVVLLRADVYEGMKELMEYDDSPWTEEERDLLVAEAFTDEPADFDER